MGAIKSPEQAPASVMLELDAIRMRPRPLFSIFSRPRRSSSASSVTLSLIKVSDLSGALYPVKGTLIAGRMTAASDIGLSQFLCGKVSSAGFAVFQSIKNLINDRFTIHTLEPPVLRLNDHDRTGFTLLETGCGDNQGIQTTVQDFFLDVLQETIGLLVTDAFGFACCTKTLTTNDHSLRYGHD